MKIRSVLLVSFLFAAALASVASAASDYAIQLERKATVGERYHVVATAADEQAMTAFVDGQQAQARSERVAFEFTADCEVTAVTPGGRESQLKITIGKLARTDPTQPGEILPAGTVVVADFVGEKTKFTVGGEPVKGPVARALETLGVNVRDDSKTSQDELFGTKDKKKVGDSWPINTAAAAKDLVKIGAKVDTSQMTGSATLVEVTKANDQPALRLTAAIAMTGVAPPLPPGLELKKSEFKAEFSGLFPVDATQPHPQESQMMAMEVNASGQQNGRMLDLTMSKKTTRESKFTRN